MIVNVSPTDILFLTKLALAACLGAIVGFDRRLHGKDVGMRSQSLICLGAALIASLADEMQIEFVAGGIITGIGFLGAGLIFRAEDHVHGITTAAEVWVMAAIGMAVGFGFFVVAAGGTIIVLLVLDPFQRLETYMLERAEKLEKGKKKRV